GGHLQRGFEDLALSGAVVQGHLDVQTQPVRAAQRRERRDRNQAAGLQVQVGPRPDFAGEEIRNQMSEVGRKPGPSRAHFSGALLAEQLPQHRGPLTGHFRSLSALASAYSSSAASLLPIDLKTTRRRST